MAENDRKEFLRFRHGILGNQVENTHRRFSAKVDFAHLNWEESSIPPGATTLPLFLMKGKNYKLTKPSFGRQ